MLYKLLLVIASVLSMLASSLVPAGVITGFSDDGNSPIQGSAVPLQRLATVAKDGTPGVGVSALWVEIDGEPVDEDVVAHGYLKELRFKVGLRVLDGQTLAIGSSKLPLTPTDVITVREFSGKIQIARTGTDALVVGLDGEVQATFVNDAQLDKIRTEGRTSVPKTQANLAYVQLDIGEKVSTVDLAPGGDAIATASSGTGTAPIPVAWLRVGSEVLTTYTWNEGFAESLEFLALDSGERLVVAGQKTPLAGLTRVLVERFHGTYVLFEGENGALQLKLEGFAEKTQVIPVGPEALGLAPKPVAAFDYEPAAPTTSDTVVFVDHSEPGPGASILLREWNFGDGTISTATSPKHRFKEPARTYSVTLVVTDSNLERSEPYTVTITPLNSRPVAEFDFYPKIASDIDAIQFTDRSWDVDGPVVAWLWEFGDGLPSSADRNPVHVFPDDGVYTVRLTVRDEAGAVNSISKVIQVSNVPPSPSLSFLPSDPTLNDVVELRDVSSDLDGTIVQARWSLGDGSPDEIGPVVRHRYAAVGEFPISLTVTDDDGATGTVTSVVRIRNLPPLAAFEITTPPAERTTGRPICFRDVSSDDENAITSRTWRFGTAFSSDATPCYTFPAQGPALVNLTVRDQRGAYGYTEATFEVLNGAPTADFVWTPVAPRTNEAVAFSSSATDPDGASDLATFTWTFHDGSTATGTSATKTFGNDGAYPVTLTVTDNSGHTATRTIPVAVANRAPRASFSTSTTTPVAGTNVVASSTSADADGSIAELIWAYDDGYSLRGPATSGNMSNPSHAFAQPGLHRVTLTAIDDDGAQSTPFSVLLDVLPPPPIADFEWAPAFPIAFEPAQFTSRSYGVGTDVVSWAWDFDDGGATSPLEDPQYAFGRHGPFYVKLTVTDNNRPAQSSFVTKEVMVNARPDADFATQLPLLHTEMAFTDQSSDADGTITNWTWDFGDGSPFSYERNPTHRWDRAGSFPVSLTVRDDRGAAGTQTTVLQFANRAPAAAFSFTPSPPVANSTIQFVSTATDAENTLVSHQWTITTDGAAPVTLATGSGPTFNHVFPLTSIYVVQLRVVDVDGAVSSMSQKVRVVSDAAKTIEFPLVYPDGTGFDVGSNTVTQTTSVRSSLNRATNAIPSATLSTPVAGTARLILPPGTWAAGDTATTTFTSVLTGRRADPREGAPAFVLTASAFETEPTVRLTLRADFVMAVLPPENARGVTGSYEPWEEISPGVYAFANQTERVRVSLRAYWEGTTVPVVAASFDVNSMWVGTRNFFPNGDPTSVALTGSSRTPALLSATERTGTTDALGEIVYTIPYLTPAPPSATSQANTLQPGYLPGWYRVSASITINAGYPAPPIGSVAFFEDPLGLLHTTFNGGRPLLG